MGNPASKPEETPENKVNSGVTTAALLTPSRFSELDPRSPSCNIARTPIEQVLHSDVLNALAAEEQEVDKPESFCKILDFDPRSPTTEFVRTPIVVESSVNPDVKLRNKNLDNVRKQISHLNSDQPNKRNSDFGVTKRPKSSAFVEISNRKIDYEKRRSIPGLLETNLDDVLSPPLEIQNLNCSPTKIRPKTSEIDKVLLVEEVQANDKDIQDSSEEKLKATVQTDDNSHTGTPCSRKAPKNDATPKLPDLLSSERTAPNKVDLISPIVEEFNKKLSTLIYEDENFGNDRVEGKEFGNRTPLSVRNGNERPVKNKLRVSDKPSKRNSLSKIPVPRDKKKDKLHKFSSQCENTPPKNMENMPKSKVTKWDNDNTLII